MNYKINLKFWAACSALIMTFFGCNKVLDDSKDPVDTNLYLTVNMPSQSASVVTRSASSEVAIKSAYVIIYGKDADDTTAPKYAEQVVPEDIKNGTTGVNSRIIPFFKDGTVVKGDVIYVIFNKTITDLTISKAGLIEATKLATSSTGASSGLADLEKGLPMYGFGEWTATGSPIISVKRGVAKVQLKLVYGSEGHVPGDMGSSYTTENTTFKLYQLSDMGYINGTSVAVTGSEPIATITNIDEINQPSAKGDDNFTGASYIYAYPYSTRTIGATPISLTDNKPKTERLAMIMKNKTSTGFVYHRLDICDPSSKTYFDIINNYHYTVKLREVGNGGYPSATSALIHAPSNIKYDIIVEDEGTDVVTNGQYVLNVNTKSYKFEVAGAPSIIELAQVNRVASEDAPMNTPSDFAVSLSGLSVSTAKSTLAFALNDVPDKLDRDVKSINVAVSGADTGTGVAVVKYIATLGNIVYDSNLITLNSNFGVVSAKKAGETLTFNIFSSSNEWSVKSSDYWAVATKTDNILTVSIERNGTDERTANITVSNKAGHTIVITIIQDGNVHLIWADRNVGPTFIDKTTNLPMEGDVLQNALKDYLYSRNHYTVWYKAVDACKSWRHEGRSDWYLPSIEDFRLLMMYKKVFNPTYTIYSTTFGDVYFPLSGYSLEPHSVHGNYWSSTSYNETDAYELLTRPTNVIEHTYPKSTGYSIRCVRRPPLT